MSSKPPTWEQPEKNENGSHDSNLSLQPSTKDLIAYALLVVGIILLFFFPIYGGIIIGAVAGVYFSKEILAIIQDANDVVEKLGLARSLILAGVLLAFFIAAPTIFIGAAIVILLRWFVFNESR